MNAPLLRYVDSLRTHGHRAARIDPLDILQREEVAALSPERYGLTDPARTYDINGILWTRPAGEDAGPEHWTLERITRHFRDVYVGHSRAPSEVRGVRPAEVPELEAAEDDGPVDETGLDPKEIELVMAQVNCSRAKAVKVLKENGGDIINASKFIR